MENPKSPESNLNGVNISLSEKTLKNTATEQNTKVFFYNILYLFLESICQKRNRSTIFNNSKNH